MTTPTDTTPKLSKVEHVKEASNGLAGTLKEVYESSESHFSDDDAALIKHHGSYQQDNRDERAALKREGKDKAWIFMVRTKIPGGRLTAEQYLAEDEIARKFTYGSVRVTSRQGIQFHGVGKENLKKTIKAINDARMTTLGACGDVNRNTMACPVCDLDWRADLHLENLALRIADHFTPHSTAYYEIWCDGEKMGQPVTPTREEPLYGKTYLPRKFKMSVAVPEDNCVDLYSHDLAAEAVHDGKKVLAYDLLVGGGMGFTHAKKETYPRIASRICRIKPEEAIEVIETIVKIQRDFGGRADRIHARIKYLLDDRGLDWFKAELFKRLGRDLPEAGPQPKYKILDHLGWHESRDGKLYVGIHIANVRIKDSEKSKLQSGLREIVARFKPEVRLTPLQNFVMAGIDPKQKSEYERMFNDFGIATVEKTPILERRSMACPALPTCGLALADSERALPSILDQIVALGSGGHQIELRMTGCPNSCVRTPMAEIGISGRGPGKYVMHIGGSHEGTRLAYHFRESVTTEELPTLVHQMIQAWQRGKSGAESFGDWAQRLGREGVEAALSNGK